MKRVIKDIEWFIFVILIVCMIVIAVFTIFMALQAAGLWPNPYLK